MEEININGRRFFSILLAAGFLFFIYYFFWNAFNQKTKIVFCDVGQGDATYIRIKNKIDVLIDAGPDRKILSCLGHHMPFWDKKIEIAIISHPQKDHFGGFLFLLDRYKIEKIFLPPLDNPSLSFQILKGKIIKKSIPMNLITDEKNLKLAGDNLVFIWPTAEFLAKNLIFAKKNYTDNILGKSTLDDNNFSIVCLFQEEDFKALFTGDASPFVLNSIVSKEKSQLIEKIDLLKIPHHGSKNGLTKKFLMLAKPQVAVISVGKNNGYGHPNEEILAMLEAQKVKIKRTDKEGEIIFKLPN
jgi:beta-lactamase superfamily II metal-dependent hydrolase